MNYYTLSIAAVASLGLVACQKLPNTPSSKLETVESSSEAVPQVAKLSENNPRFDIYASFKLTSDLSHLSDNQRKMISLLIDASKIMDDLFWLQAYGQKSELLNSISNPKARYFADVNYGPWDRLAGDATFLKDYPAKTAGAGFYPQDMEKIEYEQWQQSQQKFLADNPFAEQYSVMERNSEGQLTLVPYHKKYQAQLTSAASILIEAAKYAENSEFKKYLTMRAEALTTDQYQASDFAWMDMKSNPIELVIGAIENYEDQAFGYRSAFESYVLIKDLAWSEKLSKFAAFLPELQQGLPVATEYKAETPGTDADLNAYDVVYYAGHSNAGSKTIAINLPNDEAVQLKKGTRRLQLKNAMQAKFDKILMPIAEQLIVPEQQKFITFDAFFANTMFHEVAHGLGIKNTITGRGPVRIALKETASALEEGKADILGLYMITELYNKGEIKSGQLMDNFTTFMAGIFRSVRFGASSAHGKANMVRFNYFKEKGAFQVDPASGLYRVDFDKMKVAMNDLSNLLLTIQGNGDYEGAKKLLADQGTINDDLQQELDKLTKANIPVDIVFEQGKTILGLTR